MAERPDPNKPIERGHYPSTPPSKKEKSLRTHVTTFADEILAKGVGNFPGLSRKTQYSIIEQAQSKKQGGKITLVVARCIDFLSKVKELFGGTITKWPLSRAQAEAYLDDALKRQPRNQEEIDFLVDSLGIVVSIGIYTFYKHKKIK